MSSYVLIIEIAKLTQIYIKMYKTIMPVESPHDDKCTICLSFSACHHDIIPYILV